MSNGVDTKVVVNLATGTEDPERVIVAFLVAGAALDTGKRVAFFLTKEAVRLALPGHAMGEACRGCPPLERLFEQVAEKGGELLVCPICLNARGLEGAELVPNARVAGASPLWEWIGDGATVFSYWPEGRTPCASSTVLADTALRRRPMRAVPPRTRTVDRDHPEMQRTDEQIRQRVEDDAHDAWLEERLSMSVDIGINVEVLKSEIKKTYASVSQEPEKDFIFPTGRAWAEDLVYPDELARVPDAVAESFAGVANPFSLGRLEPGERVLDLGCGAGTDSLVSSLMVGLEGSVTGIDMTPEMLAKARAGAAELGAKNVTFVEGEAEQLPFEDESFDVVISNGVIDLIPDKDAVFGEIHRVLVPRGRIQIADVTIQQPVSEEGRRKIDLWTGWIAGALLDAEYAAMLQRHGFERIEHGNLVNTYMRSKFEDTRQKAIKYGAQGATVKAFKP